MTFDVEKMIKADKSARAKGEGVFTDRKSTRLNSSHT